MHVPCLRRRGRIDDPFAAEAHNWADHLIFCLIMLSWSIFNVGGLAMIAYGILHYLARLHPPTKYGWPIWTGALMFLFGLGVLPLIIHALEPYLYGRRVEERRRRRQELLESNNTALARMPAVAAVQPPRFPAQVVMAGARYGKGHVGNQMGQLRK